MLQQSQRSKLVHNAWSNVDKNKLNTMTESTRTCLAQS